MYSSINFPYKKEPLLREKVVAETQIFAYFAHMSLYGTHRADGVRILLIERKREY